MLTRDAAVRGLLVTAIVLTGACAEGPPTEPVAAAGAEALFGRIAGDRAAFTGTLDHEFVRIAQEIPGFGGMFYDEGGTLTVIVAGTPPMSQAELEQRIAARLEALGQPAGAAQGLRVRTGRYDFPQLFEMRRQIDGVVWALRGVVFTDADEAANRVTIGVEDAAARSSAEQALAMLGIPSDAAHVEIVEPLRSTAGAGAASPQAGHTLQDRIRPVAGGLRLQTSAPFFGSCGVGFNVRSPEAPGVHGFVADAFCVENPYGTGPLGTLYYQPSPGPDNLIGTEVHNASPFMGGDCPPNPNPDWFGCRWTTAAGGRYAPGVANEFGAIYRTTGIGSIEIDPANPMFEIVDELSMPLLGQEVHKIGAQTGWTQGVVDQTCTNVGHTWIAPGQTGVVTVLCQVRATAPSSGSFDRGGPVFERVGEDGARLAGLVSFPFGATVFFSPMAQIRLENPPPPGLTWVTHP